VNEPRVIYKHQATPEQASMAYKTELIEYELGVWEVMTHRLEPENGNELVNNTGVIEDFPQAEYLYERDLNIYYGITLEESLRQQALDTVSELEERVEIESITLQVLADELAKIAEKVKDIERQVKEL
jgi:hypothetical protein